MTITPYGLYRLEDEKTAVGTLDLTQAGSPTYTTGKFRNSISGGSGTPATDYLYWATNSIDKGDLSFNFWMYRENAQDYILPIGGGTSADVDLFQLWWDRRAGQLNMNWSLRDSGTFTKPAVTFASQAAMDALIPVDTWTNIHWSKDNSDGTVSCWIGGASQSVSFLVGSAANLTSQSGTYAAPISIATGQPGGGGFQAIPGMDGRIDNLVYWRDVVSYSDKIANGERGALNDATMVV
jgi:hypothetical protein